MRRLNRRGVAAGGFRTAGIVPTCSARHAPPSSRGLFLRNYLSHATREKLPDAGSEYDEAGGIASFNSKLVQPSPTLEQTPCARQL